MMYYRISKNEKILFFGKKIAQVWAVTFISSEIKVLGYEQMYLNNRVVINSSKGGATVALYKINREKIRGQKVLYNK